jgi:hypothetical protein
VRASTVDLDISLTDLSLLCSDKNRFQSRILNRIYLIRSDSESLQLTCSLEFIYLSRR